MVSAARSEPRWAHRRPATLTWLLCLVICLPAVMLLIVCIRGTYSDVRLVRAAVLTTETSRMRSQATRRAGHLETALELHMGSISSLDEAPWMQRYWEQVSKLDEHQLYAAIVDRSGKVLMHTDPSQMGKDLGRRWYDYAVTEAGSDIVHLSRSNLANNRPAFDIRVPLTVEGKHVADFHQGLDSNWFESEVAALQRQVLQSWIWVIALAAATSVAALAALTALAKRHLRLLARIGQSGHARTIELNQIAAGLAHEIRNPLHSLRINLYMLKRALTSGRAASAEDLGDSMQESNNAIDGLERLMRDLLRFTDADKGQRIEVNLATELRATLNLLQAELEQKRIDLRMECPQDSVPVYIDPSRLRQMLQNLLTYAENNAGSCGQVEVSLKCENGQAEITVVDSGPKLSESEQATVFEPFQARRETGSGLGLALVRAFAEEAGGGVLYNGSTASRSEFRVVLPVYSSTSH